MKHTTFPLLIIFMVLVVASSCYKTGSGPSNPWDKVDLNALGPVRNMFSAPAEVIAITDQEFYRIDADNEVIEKRSIGLPAIFFGRPALSNWVFTRFIKKQNKDVVEFHLVRNEAQVVDINVNEISFIDPEVSVSFDGTSQQNTAAFNTDGSQMIFPVRLIKPMGTPKFGFVLMDITVNNQKDAFIAVAVDKTILVDELDANPDAITNITFINGNYYVTSLQGAFRITPAGNVNKVASSWTVDSFSKGGKIYLTTTVDFEFFVSDDNGLTFTRYEDNSPVRFVDQADNKYFHQSFPGSEFFLISDDFTELNEIVYNKSFDAVNDGSAFTKIVYTNGRYYLSLQNQIYYVEDIELAE